MAVFAGLLGPKLLTQNGEVDTAQALSGKEYVLLYFSAHWCPPCRAFTPKLAKRYSVSEANAEVVFLSADRDARSFQQYFAEMPWKAVPFARRDLLQSLQTRFSVSGYPTLLVLDAAGNLLTKDGRSKFGQYLGSDPNFTRGGTTRFVKEHQESSQRHLVVALIQGALALVVGGAYIYASRHVVEKNEAVTTMKHPWPMWYLVMGVGTIVQNVLMCCITYCGTNVAMNEHFLKGTYYGQHDQDELQAEEQQSLMADTGSIVAGGLACCGGCAMCLMALPLLGWSIYGFVLFIQDGFNEKSKYYAYLIIVVFLLSCCNCCWNNFNVKAGSGGSEEEESGEE